MQKQRLEHLHAIGFNPKFILDIGACVGEWATIMKSIFPFSDYLLIEANKDNEPQLIRTGFNYKIMLLGNTEKEVEFFKIKNGYNTGNSIFIEQTHHFTGDNFTVEKLEMKTLDAMLSQHVNTEPDFIKMDVQGAELLILDGAKNSLKNCEFILLETQIVEYNKNAPKIKDVILYMDNIGYETYDIVDNHYLQNGTLIQTDILFCKKDSKYMLKGQIC